MTRLKIKFQFKAHKPGDLPLPLANANFRHGNMEYGIPCLVDSGADFCTIPAKIGRLMLGIDFEKKIAPYEIKREWLDIDKTDDKKLSGLIEKIILKKVAIPISIGCACGKGAGGFLYPVQIEIGDFKKDLLVFWIEAEDIVPLIGRLGVFDRADAVVFKRKENYGYFEF